MHESLQLITLDIIFYGCQNMALKTIMSLFYFLIFYCTSAGSLIYKDDNDQIIVSCTEDFSGQIHIPSHVTEIFNIDRNVYAFRQCKNNTISLFFETNSEIVKIYPWSFYRTKLELIDFTECRKLIFLNDSAFQKCNYLKSVILPPKYRKTLLFPRYKFNINRYSRFSCYY